MAQRKPGTVAAALTYGNYSEMRVPARVRRPEGGGYPAAGSSNSARSTVKLYVDPESGRILQQKMDD